MNELPDLAESKSPQSSYGPPLPGPLARIKRWLVSHHVTLMAINDTPHSIALGSAIGIFFGFTPLWSMKTLLSIAIAWLFRSNKLAAAIAVTLHDVFLPLMPAIYVWQYKIGYWVLHHATPHKVRLGHLGMRDFFSWSVFLRVVWPAMIGSLFLALPSAVAVYFIMRLLIRRSRAGERPA